MRLRAKMSGSAAGFSLTRQVALLSLLPILALGLILAQVLQNQIVARTLADATRSARVIAHIGIQPHLSPQTLRTGLSPAGVKALDQQLSGRSVTEDLARIKIWNSHDRVIYSDDHSLIGRTLQPSDDLLNALAGRPNDAEVVTPEPHTETASEVGLGQLVEVYVPLRFRQSGPPEGAFEIYLSYRPIAAALASDKRTIVLLIVGGLALLWAILYRIVVRASRRLRGQARENYKLARYDSLTGLANRTLFIESVATAVQEGRRSDLTPAVLLIDVDRFTEMNSTLGSVNGDLVLREVARRLSEEIGGTSLAARLGGDEFALLWRSTDGDAGALALARVVQSTFEAPVVLEDVALNVEVTVGVAAIGEHAQSAQDLMRRADTALAYARSHAARIELYAPEHDSFDAAGLVLLGQVREALERGEFQVHYQPKLDLRGRRISGVEALVRWQHPQRGLLAPGEFIPLIEQTALMGPLTLHVIDVSLQELARWRAAGTDIELSVNLSARNLLDHELPGRIACLLEQHGIPARQLTLEVTESAALVDPDRAIATLSSLREMGTGVSIDDFGTGSASIEYLATLPATELKIDRSFITNILLDKRAQAIVRSTIDLARNLELTVVAEGIETQEVMDHLAQLGCDTAQGYHIARPLPASEIAGEFGRSFAVSPAAYVAEVRGGGVSVR